MIKAILFDFDGVIADSFHIAQDITIGIAKERGLDIDTTKLREMTPNEIMKQFKIPKFKIPLYYKKAKRQYYERRKHLKLFPGMKQIIQKIELPMAVVSSAEKISLLGFLEEHSLTKHFKIINCGISWFKKAKFIKKTIKKLNLKKEDVVYIGDEIRDIEAARKLGLKIICVAWGYAPKKVLKKYKSDFFADKPQDILKIIKSLNMSGRNPRALARG